MQLVGTIVAVMIGLVIIATPIAIASLKGRWWIGVAGALLFLSAFAVLFGVIGGEPDAAFQLTTTFKIVEAVVNVALYGGGFLLILGAAMRPRPGSWWHRNRGAQSAS
jgi:hypothetical protein